MPKANIGKLFTLNCKLCKTKDFIYLLIGSCKRSTSLLLSASAAKLLSKTKYSRNKYKNLDDWKLKIIRSIVALKHIKWFGHSVPAKSSVMNKNNEKLKAEQEAMNGN